MSYNSEPSNNQITTPDIDGRLSSDGTDGMYSGSLLQYNVQSSGQSIAGSSFSFQAVDPVDYIAYSLNRNVGYVDVIARTSTDESGLLNRGGVFGVSSQYNFTPRGDFSGPSLSLKIRAGADIYGQEAASLIGQLSDITTGLSNDYNAKAAQGIDDVAIRSDLMRVGSVNLAFSRLYETDGTNVNSDQAKQIATDIRSQSSSSNGTAYSSQIRSVGTRLSQISDDWNTLQYSKSVGGAAYTNVSALDFFTNSKVRWETSTTETGAPRTGILELSGVAGLYTADDAQQSAPVQVPNTFIEAHATVPVCFTTGTRIRTTRGDVTVETLRVGDLAVTASGTIRPITWIGHRDLDGQGRALPHDQQPVRVRAGAFGHDLPARDLSLSPGHPVLVGADADGQGGHLVPIMCLINGTSIARMPVSRVTYWHVELDAHDILLAEGLPAESYLDGGDRPFFDEGSDHALHNPDFIPPGWSARCRPVAVDGPVVEAERVRLSALFAETMTAQCCWTESAFMA